VGPYKLSVSVHNLPAIELQGGDRFHHLFLRSCIQANHMEDEAYRLRSEAGAFLQGQADDHPMWTLVEFWKPTHERFVRWLNDQVENNTERYQWFVQFKTEYEKYEQEKSS
jgi:hypothetical protein